MQAAVYLAATRSANASEARICNERAESLCRALNRPQMLYVALMGQWRYYLVSLNLRKAMQIATRMHSLAQQHHDFALLMKVHVALAVTHYYLGDFTHARQEATSGVRLWHSAVEKFQLEELDEPIIGCLCYKAFCAWHSGQIASARSTMGEAILVAKRLKNTHGIQWPYIIQRCSVIWNSIQPTQSASHPSCSNCRPGSISLIFVRGQPHYSGGLEASLACSLKVFRGCTTEQKNSGQAARCLRFRACWEQRPKPSTSRIEQLKHLTQ